MRRKREPDQNSIFLGIHVHDVIQSTGLIFVFTTYNSMLQMLKLVIQHRDGISGLQGSANMVRVLFAVNKLCSSFGVFFVLFFLGKPKVASLFLSGMLGKTVIEIEREKTELVTSVNKAAYPN